MKNYKKILLPIILILLLFIISSVSAVDVTLNPGDASGINGAISQVNNTSDVSNSITLNNGTYNKTTDRNNNITFNNKNLTIKGIGNVTIDAQRLGQIFNITGNSNIRFININFINGKSTDGGAIAIYNTGGTLTVTDCSFANNNATYGGAIYLQYNTGSMNINNSNFTNNTANRGGALYLGQSNLNIKNSSFYNNYASTSGSDINNFNSPNLSIIESKFINSRTGAFGGSIYNFEGDNLLIKDSNFSNASSGWGGALYNSGSSNVTISNTNFTNCNASHGGAILNNVETNRNLIMNMTISNSNFINNTVTRSGGAILNSKTELSIINSNFTNNKAIDYGGAIFSQHENLTLRNSNFTNNGANIGGGALTVAGSIGSNITNCNFNFNNATRGGAVYNDEDTQLSINDSYFEYNDAIYGSAIYNDGAINIISSNLTNNKNGAVIFINANNTLIRGCNILNNSEGILINNTSNNITINYNRIFNNIEYDINNTGFVNVDFNWWGSNNPDMNKIIGTTLNNYFVMNTTNATSLDSNGTVKFQYMFKLNTGEKADNSLLPYFVTDVYTNLTNGVITSFDARFDRTFDVTVNTSGSILYTFVTDNEIQTLQGKTTIPSKPSNMTVNNPKGKDGETIDLIAKLTDKNGNAIAGKTITFHIAGMTLTAITDINGIAKVQYTINKKDFTNNKLAFTVTFEGDENYTSTNKIGTITLLPTPEPTPVPPTPSPKPKPTPELENGTSNNPTASAVMKTTGIPINLVLIMLLSLIGLCYHRKQ